MRNPFRRKQKEDRSKNSSKGYTRQKSNYDKVEKDDGLKENPGRSGSSHEDPDALARLQEDEDVQALMEQAMEKGKSEDSASIQGMLGKGVSTLVRSLKKVPGGGEDLLDDDDE